MTMAVPERDPYRTSRLMYIIEAMVENFITILTSGVFLATLSKTLGISDSTTAILSSITALSGLFQIFAVLVAHKTPVKRWLIPLQITKHLLLCGLYLIPLFGFGRYAGALFFMLILGANAISGIISSVKVNWFYSMVEPQNRGSFSGILTAVSVIGQIFFSLGASYVFDSYTAVGNVRGAFAAITVTILVLIVLDALPLILSREKPAAARRAVSPFSSVKGLFTNEKYRKLMIVLLIQAVCSGMAPAFLSTYQINELGFSLSFIAMIDVIVNVVWTSALLIFGRLSKKLPYATLMQISAAMQAISYLTLIFVVPANGRVLFTVYRCFMIIQGSASAVACRSLIFDLVPEEERTSALAIHTMLTGITSFAVTLSLTSVFTYLQQNRLVLFGSELYAQQVFAICSFSLALVVNLLWLIFGRTLKIKH